MENVETLSKSDVGQGFGKLTEENIYLLIGSCRKFCLRCSLLLIRLLFISHLITAPLIFSNNTSSKDIFYYSYEIDI